MAGITRFVIDEQVTGRGSWRFKVSRKRWPAANKLYRSIFDRLRMPLLPDDDEIHCSLQEFMAGYDHELAIDVLLTFESGMQMTLQEKFLYKDFKTVTVEYRQDWRTEEPGDWFNLRAQCYFTGYDRLDSGDFQDWILLDWPAVQRATAQGRIRWRENRNRHDGARASFRYTGFDQIPPECVIAMSEENKVRQLELLRYQR